MQSIFDVGAGLKALHKERKNLNMKKNDGTSNRAITLVALVITIVLMLILVGVSVNIVTDGKLIGTAENAVDKSNNKVAQQQGEVDELMGELDTVIQSQCEHEWGEWSIIKETSCAESGSKKHTCPKCEKVEIAEIAPLPHTLENGVCTVCEHKLVIGAYIYGYDPSIAEDGSKVNTSYTSPKGTSEDVDGGTRYTGNGYGDQSFTVGSITKWRVVGEENGQIKITSADPIQTDTASDYYLKGQAGYANGIEELNKICSIYGQGKYADTSKFPVGNGTINASGGRSINNFDISNNETEKATSKTYTQKKNSEGTIKIYTGDVESGYSNFNYYDETDNTWKSLMENESVTLTNKWISIKERTDLQEEMILKQSDGVTNSEYYLAYLTIELNPGYTYFGLLYSQGIKFLGNSYGGGSTQSSAIRPVVYLKSDTAIEYDATTESYTIK